MAQLNFDQVINLTATSASAPHYSDKLFIGNEPMNSIWQYCLRGETLLYKEALVDNANYNSLEWHTVIPNSIQRACKSFSMKTFPGVGAIGCYTPTYGTSKFLMPVHVTGEQPLAAPRLSMVDHGSTLTFVVTPPANTEYKCYRILLEKTGYAEEHITYTTTVSVAKPSINGTYTCYCIGYVDEGSRVSEDSNVFTIVVANGKEQQTPIASSYATVEELNKLSEDVSNITNANGTGALDGLDDLIQSWCSKNDATFIDGGKIYSKSITSEQLDVDNLTALTSNLSGFKIAKKVPITEDSDSEITGNVESTGGYDTVLGTGGRITVPMSRNKLRRFNFTFDVDFTHYDESGSIHTQVDSGLEMAIRRAGVYWHPGSIYFLNPNWADDLPVGSLPVRATYKKELLVSFVYDSSMDNLSIDEYGRDENGDLVRAFDESAYDEINAGRDSYIEIVVRIPESWDSFDVSFATVGEWYGDFVLKDMTVGQAAITLNCSNLGEGERSVYISDDGISLSDKVVLQADGSASMKSLTVDGSAAVKSLSVDGSATVKSLSVNGSASVDKLTASSSVSAKSITTSGAVSAGSVTTSGAVSAGSVTTSGAVSAGSLKTNGKNIVPIAYKDVTFAENVSVDADSYNAYSLPTVSGTILMVQQLCTGSGFDRLNFEVRKDLAKCYFSNRTSKATGTVSLYGRITYIP